MPRRPLPGAGGKLVQRLDTTAQRLDLLEQPDAGQLLQAKSKIETLIANIGTYVNAFLATANLVMGGNVSISGFFFNPPAPTNNITAARSAGWWRNSDGQAGTATSSERFKTNIRAVIDDPDFDDLAVIELEVDYWNYIAEVRKRDDPSFEDYVGPEYHVALNFGPIAERAHELGLWMIVVYERDKSDALILDGNGQPIPFALHDSLFGYLLQLAVRRMRVEQLRDRALLEAVAARVGVERSTDAEA